MIEPKIGEVRVEKNGLLCEVTKIFDGGRAVEITRSDGHKFDVDWEKFFLGTRAKESILKQVNLEFAPGDVVQLRSGGFWMTVGEVVGAYVHVHWMGDDAQLKEAAIRSIVLKRADMESA